MKCIEKFAYGVGHTTNDLCSAIWFTYVLIFYELALEFPTLYSGLVMLVGQIADAVATPIIGVLCDRGPTFWKINLRKRKIWLFCNVTQALIPLYLNITLLMDKPTIASLPFVMYSSSFIASLLSAYLNDSIGRKLTFLIGSLFAFGASLWIRIDTSNLYKYYFIYIVTILIGFSSSLLLVTALAVTNDHIGDDINNAAFLYGILSFADKLSCGIIIMVIQALEKYSGSMYYRDVLSYLCASSSGIGLLCIFTMKKENQNQVENLEGKGSVKKSRPLRIIRDRSSI
ncbi:major facilitator superfamily domain-containing protein 12-like [Rhodnius prolixus]|uniref:major facilitator superfamily domain-containing protein 12-like n=1 Tax=Rhodnius prolixus TaxID=13249 RepID=UPI003D188081